MARNHGDKNLNDREKVFKAQIAAIEAKYQAKLTAKDVVIQKLKKQIKQLKEKLAVA